MKNTQDNRNLTFATRAESPETDPCDVALEAMPGYICGDLEQIDRKWVDQHAKECRYCDNELRQFQQSSALVDLAELELGTLEPPPLEWMKTRPVARYGVVDSMLGQLLIAVSDKGVCEVGFVQEGSDEYLNELRSRGYDLVEDDAAIRPVVERLEGYFSGASRSFDYPVDLEGVTPFTQSVLRVTAGIPFGALLTYKDVAREIGRPGASRAVGNALGRNPVPVIVPCHRVIRSDHSLGGYTGGLGIKETLLRLEGAAL